MAPRRNAKSNWRSKLIKFEGCYHGHADALLVKAGSGLATFGNATSAGVPPEVVQHTLVLEYNNLKQLEEAFALHGKDLACLMIEPIAGNMNFVRASVPFVKRCRELCSQYGALLVFDEVMAGFRVALGGAQSVQVGQLCFAPQRSRLVADDQGHQKHHEERNQVFLAVDLESPARRHKEEVECGDGPYSAYHGGQ